jgi:hypothetical protein
MRGHSVKSNKRRHKHKKKETDTVMIERMHWPAGVGLLLRHEIVEVKEAQIEDNAVAAQAHVAQRDEGQHLEPKVLPVGKMPTSGRKADRGRERETEREKEKQREQEREKEKERKREREKELERE